MALLRTMTLLLALAVPVAAAAADADYQPALLGEFSGPQAERLLQLGVRRPVLLTGKLDREMAVILGKDEKEIADVKAGLLDNQPEGCTSEGGPHCCEQQSGSTYTHTEAGWLDTGILCIPSKVPGERGRPCDQEPFAGCGSTIELDEAASEALIEATGADYPLVSLSRPDGRIWKIELAGTTLGFIPSLFVKPAAAASLVCVDVVSNVCKVATGKVCQNASPDIWWYWHETRQQYCKSPTTCSC